MGLLKIIFVSILIIIFCFQLGKFLDGSETGFVGKLVGLFLGVIISYFIIDNFLSKKFYNKISKNNSKSNGGSNTYWTDGM